MNGDGDRILEPVPWFGPALRASVAQLTDRQEAWFYRCVSWQWEHGVVPIDEQALRKIASPEFGTLPGEWEQFFRLAPTLFPLVCEYLGQNPAVAELRDDYIRVIDAKSEGGKRSGETRRKQRDLEESAKSV